MTQSGDLSLLFVSSTVCEEVLIIQRRESCPAEYAYSDRAQIPKPIGILSTAYYHIIYANLQNDLNSAP